MFEVTVFKMIPEHVPCSTVDVYLGKCHFLCSICKDKVIQTSYVVTGFSIVQKPCYVMYLHTMWTQYSFVWHFNVFGYTLKTRFDRLDRIYMTAISSKKKSNDKISW